MCVIVNLTEHFCLNYTCSEARETMATPMMSRPQNMAYPMGSDNPRGKMTLRNFDYEIAIHTVKIQRSGQAINIDEMKEVHFISLKIEIYGILNDLPGAGGCIRHHSQTASKRTRKKTITGRV